MLYGGIEAERLLFGDVTTRGERVRRPAQRPVPGDAIAEHIVEVCGMSDAAAPLRIFRDEKGDREVLSGTMAEARPADQHDHVECQARAAQLGRIWPS